MRLTSCGISAPRCRKTALGGYRLFPTLGPPHESGGLDMRWPWPVVLLAACVSTNAAVMNPSLKLQPVCPDGVQVFSDSSRVGKPYTEVAVLNSKGESDMTSESGMINSQRKKAAELGANGVILGQMKDASTSARVFQALLGTSANRKGGAIAIYIPSDSTRVAEACKIPRGQAPSHN